MNTTYAQQGSPPHDLGMRDIPDPYRGQVAQGAQYPHTLPVSQHPQQLQNYGHQYPLPSTRSSIAEGMPAQQMGVPLAPGTASRAHEPLPRSQIENGWKYELHVVQQPRRARMCGFGDKDRRPITPPPCVRLIITDIHTGKEVDCNDVDHGMFVLSVDLWSANGEKEVNLVRHSATSPSISCTIPVSYQAVEAVTTGSLSNVPTAMKYETGQAPYNPYPQSGPPQVTPYAGQATQYAGAQYQHPGYAPTTNGAQQYPPQNGYSQPQSQPVYYATGAQIHAAAGTSIEYPQQVATQYSATSPYSPDARIPPHRGTGPPSNTVPQGMFTRNLIGSLVASAFRLTDPDDRIGIWFVLQDLSVRTEGTFRLRFSFVNVGVSATPNQPSPGAVAMTAVNTGKAPVLAACFSEVFTVYSAKRFPGVVESTALSKCFATQGIKIPIRKDGPGKGDKDKDDDYD